MWFRFVRSTLECGGSLATALQSFAKCAAIRASILTDSSGDKANESGEAADPLVKGQINLVRWQINLVKWQIHLSVCHL